MHKADRAFQQKHREFSSETFGVFSQKSWRFEWKPQGNAKYMRGTFGLRMSLIQQQPQNQCGRPAEVGRIQHLARQRIVVLVDGTIGHQSLGMRRELTGQQVGLFVVAIALQTRDAEVHLVEHTGPRQ